MKIQKVGDISYAGFVQEFYHPGIPVIFKNASKVWKAGVFFKPDWYDDIQFHKVQLEKRLSVNLKKSLQVPVSDWVRVDREIRSGS